LPIWYAKSVCRNSDRAWINFVSVGAESHINSIFEKVFLLNFHLADRSVRGELGGHLYLGLQFVNLTMCVLGRKIRCGLSCHRFRSNQVRLALSLLAYNLGNLWRRLALPQRIENWSLTSLQQRLVKTGGRLVKHARYYWLLLAEGHLNRRRFGAMLGRITVLQLRTG
jgi:hypothetical protein